MAEELAVATGCYAEDNLLGQETQAAVYKGVLSDGMIVAMKKLKAPCSREVLLKEIQILRKLRHRNLVRVRGCILNLDVSVLVLDYMSNGSLEHYLHVRRDHEEYDWGRLTTIATGLVNALTYLHHEYGVPVINGDIKPRDNRLHGTITCLCSTNHNKGRCIHLWRGHSRDVDWAEAHRGFRRSELA
ncbi:hypothetical protein GOP47_0019900 [Adiantum capillus-veneris]|uniref:non-specific serine/threonine protein kinase n=1 Tax=Adiantum capillus-veneris TaxID=13818 RepID=A0A9D4UCE4_ADICA|nr:hypothetical protein GOP47_0019900 [Adiantum capillus-veneris]